MLFKVYTGEDLFCRNKAFTSKLANRDPRRSEFEQILREIQNLCGKELPEEWLKDKPLHSLSFNPKEAISIRERIYRVARDKGELDSNKEHLDRIVNIIEQIITYDRPTAKSLLEASYAEED